MVDGSYRRALNPQNPMSSQGKLAHAFASLVTMIYREENGVVLSPTAFKDVLNAFAPQFRGADQHDSQEFLAFLLDGLHEDLNQGKDVKGSRGTAHPMPEWMKGIPAKQDDDTLPEAVCISLFVILLHQSYFMLYRWEANERGIGIYLETIL